METGNCIRSHVLMRMGWVYAVTPLPYEDMAVACSNPTMQELIGYWNQEIKVDLPLSLLISARLKHDLFMLGSTCHLHHCQ